MPQSRIPKLISTSRANAFAWFQSLHKEGLLFCLDDDPATLVCITDGARIFTNLEANEVSATIDRIFQSLGNEAHELAFEVLSRTFHTQLERRTMHSAYD